ncbi:tRNA-methyltransferase-domain-containing protein [Astrocystis sublimbata]|nr:tRNA-methyltransferase-domain-containing protein [Astrocystis sublimbata]
MDASEATHMESAATVQPITNDNVDPSYPASKPDILNETRGVKRPAESELSGDDEGDSPERDPSQPAEATTEAAPMTKSQMKKLRRRELWEKNRGDRRLKRRDKRHERQARRRAEKDEECAAAAAEGREPVLAPDRPRHRSQTGTKVPVAILVDCQFEKYMTEAEHVSLASQITRCYSDNRGAPYPVHLYISSYGGFLQNRYETALHNQHLQWKGIDLCTGDFIDVAKQAIESMADPKGSQMIDLLRHDSSGESAQSQWAHMALTNAGKTKAARSAPIPEPEADDVDKSIVYLTADSPYTLDRLEPNTCYVVGGIIDKNREKGLCYRVAREKNVRTAKLPIGEYMVLQQRHILATNHVVEIMLKWLETGDWGTAFMSVIPMRKGGKLKTDDDNPTDTVPDETDGLSEEVAVRDDDQQAEMIPPGAREILTKQDANDATQVEGDNAEEGLTRNALDEPRWSAPPPEVEPVKDADEKSLAA